MMVEEINDVSWAFWEPCAMPYIRPNSSKHTECVRALDLASMSNSVPDGYSYDLIDRYPAS